VLFAFAVNFLLGIIGSVDGMAEKPLCTLDFVQELPRALAFDHDKIIRGDNSGCQWKCACQKRYITSV